MKPRHAERPGRQLQEVAAAGIDSCNRWLRPELAAARGCCSAAASNHPPDPWAPSAGPDGVAGVPLPGG